MQTTAQSWLVLQLSHSPAALGVMTALQFLPITLFGLFAGVVADRFPKRETILMLQILAAMQAVVLTVLVMTGTIQLWELYILALFLGIINTFEMPARQAFAVELVGKDHLQNAIALNSSLFNTARIAGPAIGGAVISLVGVGSGFLINAISFFGLILALLVMRPKEFHSLPKAPRGNTIKQLKEGVSFSLGTPTVVTVLLLVATLGAFGYNFNTFLPLLARYVLHVSAFGYGVLFSALGVGSLAAALGVAYASRMSRRALLLGAGVFSVLLFLVGASSWYPVSIVLLVLLGAASILFTSTAQTQVQLAIPNELRGRVMSLYFLAFNGTAPLGGLVVGALAATIGVQFTVMLMGILCGISFVGSILYTKTSDRRRGSNASESSKTPALSVQRRKVDHAA